MSKNQLRSKMNRMGGFLKIQIDRLWRIITILTFLISMVGMPTTVAKAAGISENFESGWSDHAFIDTVTGWYSANGIYVENDFGVGGTWGLGNSNNIFTWMGHPFQWSDPTLTGVRFGMDFQTNGSGGFDDDRVGWMIAGNSTVSDNFFGVQMDPGGTGQNIEAYWDGVTVNDGGRTSIVSLTGLSVSAWYRLQAEITKLTATSARIDVTLTALDASGNPGAVVASGSIPDTSLLPDTTDNYKPKPGYFTATTMYPAYKNHNGTAGNADNAYFEILTSTPTPIISITGTPLTAFSSVPGAPSAEKSYSVSGSNLTGNIVITPPADFEISLTSGSGWVANPNTISLAPTGTTVAATPIYVRFNRATEGISSGDITHASTGATTQNVAVSGTAALAPTCYSLTLGHTGNGSTPTASPTNSTGCPASQYVSGEAITLSGATPDGGWQIASWYGTSSSSSNTLTMPASAHSAGVNYSAIPVGNYALQFNGSNQYVTFGPSLGAEDFTLELWFNWTGGGTTANTGSGGIDAIPLITKGLHQADNSNVDANYFLGITTAGKLAADFEEPRPEVKTIQ